MPSFLLFAVTWAGMAPEKALERALDAAEPPPAMRAAFHATLTAGNDSQAPASTSPCAMTRG